MKKLLLLSSLAILTGCATKPESIMPAYVSDMGYMQYTCDQLAEEQSRLHSALASASDAQRRARSNDTVGVIFLGLPVSSLSGSNQASHIARLKGELEALQRAAIKLDCGLDLVPIDEIIGADDPIDPDESGPRARARDPRTNQGR